MARLQFAATVLSVVFLAACGGAAAPASSPAAPASAAAAPASKPAAPASAPPAASAKPAISAVPSAKPPASAAAGGSIKVGYINTTTGPLANVGKDNVDAFQLYLDSINDTVAGRKIEVSYADDTNAADVGLTKAKQLVESDKVNLLMGITGTPVCYAIAGYVKDAQVPLLVTGNCGAEILTSDPKSSSPYLARFTQNQTIVSDTLADYAYNKKGFRKAVLLTSDYGGGLETADGFGSAFVGRGGSIVQEIHPPLGTSDFGPYVSQIGSDGDVLVTFMPGIDSLRFAQAYANYSGSPKPILDHFGGLINGSNFDQDKNNVVGVTGDYAYSPALDTPANQALVKAWQAKYGNRPVSTDTGVGWSAGQILEAAVKAVNGNVEDKTGFMNAVYSLKLDTVKGPISLDKNHDVVENVYFWQAQKNGNDVGLKVVDTYNGISRNWDRTDDQIAKFDWGSFKGKWVGMTKAQLGDVLTIKPS